MEILDRTKESLKKQVPAGTILILQGDTNKAFNILHSGLAEVLTNGETSTGASPEDILGGSLRVGLIKGESPFGIMGIMDRKNAFNFSIRTVTDSIITVRPMKSEDIVTKIQSDMPLNLRVLRALIVRIESTFYLFNNYKYLWHKYASIADSIALGAKYSGTLNGIQEISRDHSTLEEYSSHLKAAAEKAHIPAPDLWDYNLFLGRIQDSLKLYDDHDKLIIEDLLDYKQFLFIKRLIRKKDEILVSIFKQDEPTNQYIFEFFGQILESMLKINGNLVKEIDNLIIKLFSDGGWVDRIITENDTENEQIGNFVHFLAKFSWRCRKDTINLLGKDLLDYKEYALLKKFKDLNLSLEKGKDTLKEKSGAKSNRLAKYKGLLSKLLAFSDLPKSFKDEFTVLLEKLKKENDKFSSDPKVEELRTKLGEKYWELYEVCFLKIIDSDLKGFIPGIMLHFGIVDETLVTEDELLLIDDFYTRNLYSDDSVPVMTLPYYLEKIYRSEVNPSLTEMGDVFRTVLINQKKMTKGQRDKQYIYEDTAEDRVRYEIRKVSMDLNGMLFGNRRRALPFLCSEMFNGNMKRFFMEPERIVLKIEKFRKRDFSIFYREVLLKHSLGTDFIQKEVPPDFILYPCAGSRMIMWQEIDGTKKDSPGRFFLPLYYSEKLDENLLYQLASYRWELQKTIAGFKWTDPVDGGMVGAYYDYIQFYKKNPNISSEAKKRLEEFIKKSKSDKDCFSKDYITWLMFEYEGKIRFNNAARDIFYRFCPFSNSVRALLSGKPLYSALDTRYQNRKQKEILKVKSRYKKFEKSNKPVPVELKKYLNYLDM